MLRSIQGVAYSMQVQADRINVTANNIANINTRAYKKDVVNIKSFDDVLARAVNYDTGELINNVGAINFGSSIDQRRTDFEQGYLGQTGYNTDLAIRGDGFFTIETPDGIQYTRAGNFGIDQDGYLVTQDGDYVLGEKGRIYLPERTIKVNMQGDVSSVLQNQETLFLDKLQIAYFNDLKQLQKAENGNYLNPVGANLTNQGKSEILQEYLENSNVNMVKETQDMLDAKRNYESCQQVIKMLDDTIGKASNEIGKV